jgi:ATP-dependent Clp protease ATP-binding subunit ClpC
MLLCTIRTALPRRAGPYPEAMFERFTDRAREVVVLAQQESFLLNHNYIGTEHILLGLIHEGEGVAAKALESLGISLDVARARVEAAVPAGESPPKGHIPFTTRAKKVLELSLREALQLGHNYIGTEHILLGLVREGEGVAAQVLAELGGGSLDRVRDAVITILSGYEGKPADEPTPRSAPRCPGCRAEVEKVGRWKVVDVSGEDEEHPRQATLLYCGVCGVTLGVLR